MKTARNWMMCAVAALSLSLAASAMAQQQGGLVNVNISDIRVDIADALDVNVSQIPVTVQAPIGVAANVCNVAVNALAVAAQEGNAECRATTTSTALNRIVQRQLVSQ